MLYVYHGNDIQRRRKAISSIKQTLLKKRSQAEVFEIDHDEFTQDQLTELVSGRGLFEEKYIVFLYNILSIEAGKEAVSTNIEMMAGAEHVFVLIEEALADNHEKLLSEYAESIKRLHTKKKDSEQKPWPLADAYGNRNRKQGWIQLHKTLQSSNNTPESIQGLLWWQTRMMWLAKTTESAKEAGQSNYPYKKAKKFATNYTEDELLKKTDRLVSMYHEAHQGQYDLGHALEQFMLEL